jgi:hypothetical protein
MLSIVPDLGSVCPTSLLRFSRQRPVPEVEAEKRESRAQDLSERLRLVARSRPDPGFWNTVAGAEHASYPVSSGAGTFSVASAISRATSVVSRFAS